MLKLKPADCIRGKLRATAKLFSSHLIGALSTISLVAVLVQDAPASAQSDELITTTPPQLTRSVLERATRMYEWALDTPFTRQERAKLQQFVVPDWIGRDPFVLHQIPAAANQWTDLQSLSDTQRAQKKARVQPALLNLLRKHASTGLSRELLFSYNANREPIAPGNPPLTRQMSDARTEFGCFIASEAMYNNDSLDCTDDEFYDAIQLQREYPSYSPDVQQQLAQLPQIWANVQNYWSLLPADTQGQFKSEWRSQIEALQADQQSTPDDTTPALPDTTWRATFGKSIGQSMIDADRFNFQHYKWTSP